jgi:hypothetical protein
LVFARVKKQDKNKQYIETGMAGKTFVSSFEFHQVFHDFIYKWTNNQYVKARYEILGINPKIFLQK